MKNQNLINQAIEIINQLSHKTANLIEIINIIDYDIIAGNDTEVNSLVSEYYNSILTQNDNVSDDLIALRKQLISSL